MSKRQTTLVKSQNRKPIPTKTQIVVSCVKNGSVEKTEKLQKEQNRIFLEERCNDGTMDDLVSLIREIWDNYQLGQVITLVEYSAQTFQESPRANLGIDHLTTKAYGGDY